MKISVVISIIEDGDNECSETRKQTISLSDDDIQEISLAMMIVECIPGTLPWKQKVHRHMREFLKE